MSILATETASATAGREGKATSADGKINLALSPPGSHGAGTNPEQLFAAGYSACFGGAIAYAASLEKIPLRMADIKRGRHGATAQGRKRLPHRRHARRGTADGRPRAGANSWSPRPTRSARIRRRRGGVLR